MILPVPAPLRQVGWVHVDARAQDAGRARSFGVGCAVGIRRAAAAAAERCREDNTDDERGIAHLRLDLWFDKGHQFAGKLLERSSDRSHTRDGAVHSIRHAPLHPS
jgi:hypothetical protein